MADIDGTDGDDYLQGTSGPDRIRGGLGKDTIFAYDGDDELFGEEDNDYLAGGIGADRLYGGDGADELHGYDGDDILRGEAGADKLYGRSGNDDIEGGDGADQIEGDGFPSSIYGDGNDRIDGGAGNDTLRGGGGNDTILGGTENDYLVGGAGEDHLDGGAGDDFLFGFGEDGYGFDEHRDTLLAGEGNDIITVGYGDTVDGGSGTDTIHLNLYRGAAAGVNVDLRQLADNGTITVGGATISGIEYVGFISLTPFDDKVIAGVIPAGPAGITMDGWGGNDELTGTAAVDSIHGGDGDDVIWGGGGLNPAISPSGDRLRGDAGNDIIHIGDDDAEAMGGEGNDLINGGAGRDNVYGDNGSDRLLGAGGDDGLHGGWGSDTLDGSSGNDILYGDDGDDRIDGGTGADLMYGGEGFDIFVVDHAGDHIDGGEGLSSVETSLASYVLPNFLTNLTGTYSGGGPGQTLRGNVLANRVLGSSADDVLSGLDGNDLIAGGAGSDFLTGGSGRDILIGGAVSGTELILNGSFETQDGSNGTEAFIRASGTYENGFASRKTPTLFGWQTATGAPFELAIENYNTAFAAGDGAATIDLESGAGENQRLFQDISGIAAGTRLVLNFTAAKAITSWFSSTSSATAVLEVVWNGVVVATITPQSIFMEQYSLVVVAAASGTGASGSNRLEFREVGAGADSRGTMLDSVSLRAIDDDAAADAANGGDTVDYSQETGAGQVQVNLQNAAISGSSGHVLDARQARDSHGELDSLWGIENVKTGAGDDSVYGDEAANRIETGGGTDFLMGGAGNDILDGGTGADTMRGGLGNDIYVVDDGGDLVEENGDEGVDEVRTSLSNYVVGANFEKLTATNNGAHDFRGNGLSNTLAGGEGNDLLRLQDGGEDSALGGGGNDILYFGSTFTGADVADGGADRDALILQGSYILTLSATNLAGIESLSLQSGARTTWGDTANNFYDYDITTHDSNVAAGQQLIVNGQSLRVGEDFAFDGSAEQDGKFLVYGGHGVDTLKGGTGNDVFFFEGSRWGAGDSLDGGAGRDALIVSAGSGLTRIEFGATSLVGIESISVTSRYATDPSAKPSYEFVLDNGNVAPGATLIVNASSLVDPTQTVSVDGSDVEDGKLILIGGAGGDTLIGGAGADLIQGLLGADDLTGGGGADTFRYTAAAESTATSMDELLDFTPGTDKIDLARIDANTLAAGDQAFSWIGSNAFAGTGAASAGELRAYESNGSWFVEGDTNGDGIADLVIEIIPQGPTPLGAGDFLL